MEHTTTTSPSEATQLAPEHADLLNALAHTRKAQAALPKPPEQPCRCGADPVHLVRPATRVGGITPDEWTCDAEDCFDRAVWGGYDVEAGS